MNLWPLPAFGAWAVAWAAFVALRAVGAPDLVSLACAASLGAVLSVFGATRWRRIFIAGGFPLSLAATGAAAALPAWGWLLPLALLAFVYPHRAWRDAPLFPTPAGALDGLADVVRLPDGACVLDAGCGLGAGLRELHRALPGARLEGLEWSWPLALACAARCRFARVRRGDIWAADWSGCGLVYLFQRPESMARALEKAQRELPAGAWLASLEFEVPHRTPDAALRGPGRKPVWLYRMR